MSDISIEESLVRSWSDYKKNIHILLLGSTLIIGASFFVLLGLFVYFSQKVFFMLVVAALFFALLVVIQIGFIKVVLNITGNKSVHVRLLYKYYRFIPRYIVGLITYLVVIFLGLLLLIVPGVMWAVRYSLWPLVMVNKDLCVTEAFCESNRLTKGSKWNLFLLYLALFGAHVLSVVPFGLGLIVSCPVGMLTCTHAYRKLQLVRTTETLQKKKTQKKEKVKAR